jgi:ABC-2 type transport system permease protein
MRYWAVFSKETTLILRDTQALIMTLFFPLFMLILYGYGVTFDINNVPAAVLDYSSGPTSRDLIQKINASGYITANRVAVNYDEINEMLVKGEIILAFVFPPDFENKIQRGDPAAIQVLVNGSDANTGSIALAYQAAIISSYNVSLMIEKAGRQGVSAKTISLISPRTRIWYNPELKSVQFVAPGVIAMVMMVLGSLLTSTSIVREKESGTIEMLIATPINQLELVLGKISPYIAVSLIAVVIVVLFSHFVMGVPIKGNLGLLFLGGLLYLTCALGFGIFSSAVANTVNTANILAVFISLLPSILLSGFIFPIESMPRAVQLVTYIVPARYFISILRGIFLKGVGLLTLWPEFMFLLIFGTVLLLISASLFKKRID